MEDDILPTEELTQLLANFAHLADGFPIWFSQPDPRRRRHPVPQRRQPQEDNKLMFIGANFSAVEDRVAMAMVRMNEEGRLQGVQQRSSRLSPLKRKLMEDGCLTMIQYEVRPGDTLSEISIDMDVPISRIMNDNEISNADMIYTGQRLTINFAEGTVQQVCHSTSRKRNFDL